MAIFFNELGVLLNPKYRWNIPIVILILIYPNMNSDMPTAVDFLRLFYSEANNLAEIETCIAPLTQPV